MQIQSKMMSNTHKLMWATLIRPNPCIVIERRHRMHCVEMMARGDPSRPNNNYNRLDAAWTKWEVESLQHGIPNTGPTETLIVREEALPLLGAQPKRALGPATNAENQLLSCRRTSRSSRLQDITHHLRTIDRIYPDSINKPQTMPTCKPIWTWKTIGYRSSLPRTRPS